MTYSKSILAVILRVNQLYTTGGSGDMENHRIRHYKASEKKKLYFQSTSDCLRGIDI